MKKKMMKMCTRQFSIPPFFCCLPSVIELDILAPEKGVNFQLHHLEHLYEKPDAKSSAEKKQFIISQPCSLHFLIQPLQLRYY